MFRIVQPKMTKIKVLERKDVTVNREKNCHGNYKKNMTDEKVIQKIIKRSERK